MQEKYEENLVNFDEEIKEEKTKVNENELVNKDRSSLKIDDVKATNLGLVEENLEEEITNETYNIPANEYDEVGNLLNQGNILPKVTREGNMIANNKQSDLIVFEPQKQDLILYEQLEKNKIHRRSMLSLILIILAFLLIVALGTSIYKILTTYTLLNADNFDLTPKNKEALQPLSDKTLTVSPYEFNGMLDLRNYYKSKSSSLNFEYYEKKGDTSEYSNVKYVKNISLSDIYKRKNEKLNYVAKVIFKTIRKYYYVDLDFDFKNVINIKTPKGDVVSSWKDYIEYPGTYQGFFEKELREKGKNILNPFTSKNDPIKRDIETWYFDKSRQERFDRNKLIDIKRNVRIKENIIYSNNAFSNNFNVSYKFLYKNNIYGDFNAKPNENISENNKNYLKNLEQRFPYPSVKINSDGSYGDDLEELINARNYYKLIGWFYLEDYPEVGISKGDEFKIDDIVPNLTYMTYKIVPKFERIALDIYYMESDDITQSESNYSLINKKKTRATLTKNNLGYDFEYNLEDYTKEYEEKYFINWIFKNGDKINNNDKFDISNLEFDKKNVYAYPKFEKYIYTEFYLLNFENLKLEKIKGKKNETILSKKKLIDKNRDTIEEVENYKYGQNEFLGYYLSDGSNLTDDLTFEQVLRYSSKVEIRYKKVPISITFKRYFYNPSIKNTQSEEIKTFTKYYETGVNKLGDVVNDYKYEILAKYPDYIMENKEDDFNLKLVDIYKFNFTIILKAPSIMLQVKVKDNENYITYTVFKDQVLPMDINYLGNEEIKGYKIYEKVNGGVVETDITLFPNDNLNTLITNKNNNRTYIADAILQRSRTGIIQIEKIFIDEHKDKTDPLYIRKYIVSEKLRNLPLGDKPGDPQNGYYEQSGYVLNDFIKTNENEISDYDRFEYVSMDGAWPDYKNKETKYTYYYRLARMETFVNCQGINIPTYDAPYEVINFTIEEKIKDNERFKHYIKKFKEYIKTHVGTDENYERHIKYVKVAKVAQAELGTRISYDEFLNLVVKKEWLKHPDYISSHLNGADFTLVVEKV